MDLNEKEYQLDKKLRKQDVRSLIEWVESQPHLPKISEHDGILFLKSCYYNNEFAKKTLDTFYTFRTQKTELCHLRTDECYKRNSKVGFASVLPQKTPEGHIVYFLHLTDANPDHFNNADLINLADVYFLSHLHVDGTHDGLEVIIDMAGFSMSHLQRISLWVVKDTLFYIQQAIPVRLKRVHFININNKTFLDMLLALAKPFMDKKLIDLLLLHGSLDDFAKFLPIEILPKDYGGQSESLERLEGNMIKMVLENKKFLEYLDNQKVDESKRPEESKLSAEVYGVSGTFKKLEFD